MENKVKTHIEIDGVILTPEALSTLKVWQEEDNYMLKATSEFIGDSVCLMAKIIEYVPEEWIAESQKCNYELSLIRDNIKSLKKP